MPADLPLSYDALPFTQIRLYHHPRSSPTVTPVIVLTLHRPERANAWTERMRQEIVDAYELFERDDRVKCVVLTGEGKYFCAGMDLEGGFETEGRSERAGEHRDGGGIAALAIHRSRIPTIGALNGSAVGVGVTLTLPMAVRVASRTARFGLVFARRGIVTESVSSYFLPRLIGYARAVHLTTTGGVYPASSDLWGGLWGEVVDQDKVLNRALEIAEDIAQNTSAVSGKLVRDLIWRGPDDPEEMHLLESRILSDCFKGKDHEEGVKSFLEKRPADFKGTMKDAPSAWPWYTPKETSAAGDKELKLKTINKAKL